MANYTLGYTGAEIDEKLSQIGTGGGSIPKPLTYDYMPEGYPTKTISLITLMEGAITEFTEYDVGIYRANSSGSFEPTIGQTYTVNWDGTAYECTAFKYSGGNFLGNGALTGIGEDTGEPFLFELSECYIYAADTLSSHTISVTTMAENFTPMDARFLPLGAGGTLIVPFTHVRENVYSYPAGMYDEILRALYEGRKVISSGLDSYNGPYEATMSCDECITFQKIFMSGNSLCFHCIEWNSLGESVLNQYKVTTTPTA